MEYAKSITPLARTGTDEEVAKIVAFLASDDSSFLAASEVLPTEASPKFDERALRLIGVRAMDTRISEDLAMSRVGDNFAAVTG
jgi:NAD(P)-dependent dehydrogenase (short-subunit alcohol dehydrogenase family)